MSIIGLTDSASLRPRLPRLGKLHKGGVKSPNKPGPDLNHFRFVGAKPEIQAAYKQALGESAQELIVYLPYRTLDECFPTWAEVWSASGLEHRCDGQTMTIWREGDHMVRGQKPCPGGHNKNDYRRDAVGRLEVVIPQLLMAGHVGVVTLETHSLNDIAGISGILADVASKRGDLRGIAFRLYRVPETISIPGFGDRAGQRSKTEKWLVKIEPSAEWVRHQLAQAQAAALAIPAPAEVIDGNTGEFLGAGSQPAAISAPAPVGELVEPTTKVAPPATKVAPPPSTEKKPVTNSQKVDAQKKAAAGQTKTPTLPEARRKWSVIWGQAIELGLKPKPISNPDKAPIETYVERGRALQAEILERATEICLAASNRGELKVTSPLTDGQMIATALKLFKKGTANVPA